MLTAGNKRHAYIYVMDHHLSAMCVCLLPRNPEDCFVSLLFESIAGKKSPDKQIVAIYKKLLTCREIVV